MAEEPATPVREGRPGGSGRVPEPLGPRALRIGLRTTLLAPLGAAASVALLGGDGPGLGTWVGIFLGLVVVGAIVAFLPWDRLQGTDIGRRIVYAWAALNVLLITLAGWSAGADDPSLPLGYAVAIVFFAILLSSRAQLGYLALLLACYATALVPTGFEPLPFAMLAVLGVLASYLSGELRRRIAAHDRARVAAERRWAVVGAVSSVARDMTAGEPRRVLQGIVDAIVTLGYETAAIHVPDGPPELKVILPAGVGGDQTLGIRAMPDAVRTQVLEGGRDAVIRPKDVDRRAVRSLRPSAIQTIVATPILVGDRPAGALIVASADLDGISAREVEAFAMLAATAAMTLGNARRAEEQAQVTERLAAAERVRTDVTSTLSKEIRKPLSALTETVHALQGTFGNEDRHRLLRRLLANATALDVTLGGSLDLSVLDASGVAVDAVDLDVGELINGVLQRLAGLFEGRELRAQVPTGITVEADRALLEAAVEHLLATAATSSPPGKTVQVDVSKAGDGAIVKVAGDGVIPAEQVSRIRQPLADRDGSIGPWIRLALAARIVEVHGSELQILSEPKRGTTVWFVLPGERSAQPGLAGGSAAAAAGAGPVQLTFEDALLPAVAAAAAATEPSPVEVPEEDRRSTPLAAAAVAATAASSLVVTGVLPELIRPPDRPVATTSHRDVDGSGNGEAKKERRAKDKPSRDDDGSRSEATASGGTPAAPTSGSTGGTTGGTTDGTGVTTDGTGGTGDGGGGGSGGGGGGEPSPSPDDSPGKSGEAPGHNKDGPTPSPGPTP